MFPFDLAEMTVQKEKCEKEMQDPGFWNEQDNAQKTTARLKSINDTLREYDALSGKVEDAEILLEMIQEENDLSLYEELVALVKETEKELEKFRLKTLLNGEYDKNSAILSIHSGAGGTEAQDWADMLLRMYLRWAEKNNYKAEIVDILPDPAAGIKSAAVLVEGLYAYGYLKS